MSEIDTICDERLITSLINGDRKAFVQIYGLYWMPLLLHAERMLHDELQAQDVVQDVFVMLWEKKECLTSQSSISGFLYTATRNRILNLFKHEKVKVGHLASLGDFTAQETVMTDYRIREKELARLIELEIEKLPPGMRKVFLLKRKEQLSYNEISESLGISSLTVKTQMNKAIKILRLRLQIMRLFSF